MSNSKLFVGQVLEYLDDNKAIIKLLNNKDYTHEPFVKIKPMTNINKTYGYILLIPSDGWRYIIDSKVPALLTELGEDIDLDYAHRSKDDQLEDIAGHTEDIYAGSRRNSARTCIADVEDIEDTSLIKSGENRKKNLFSDQYAETKLLEKYSRAFDGPRYPYKEVMDSIKKDILNKFWNVVNEDTEFTDETGKHYRKKKDQRYIMSKQLTVDNLMTSERDIEDQGSIFIREMNRKFVSDPESPFRDLVFTIHDGYIHITRDGNNLQDYITADLVPGLDNFNWQYGKPIDYETLKLIITGTDIYSDRDEDIKQLQEVKNILSQEYTIVLQPHPQYLWWCIKRLIACWYSSRLMLDSIKRVKILINQWRANSNHRYNRLHGTLPIICVVPRYGKNTAKEVMATLTHYFTLYQNLGWRCSKPSYCKKINDILWYTNGNLDIKYYYRQVARKGNVGRKPFKDNYSHVKGDTDILINVDH
jgi:hypothetical protein